MSGSVVDIPDQFQLIDSRRSVDVTKVQIEEAWKQQVRGTTLICVYFFSPFVDPYSVGTSCVVECFHGDVGVVLLMAVLAVLFSLPTIKSAALNIFCLVGHLNRA